MSGKEPKKEYLTLCNKCGGEIFRSSFRNFGEVIAAGGAELGVQQISELLPVPGIEIVGPLPGALQKITTFSAGVLASASVMCPGGS